MYKDDAENRQQAAQSSRALDKILLNIEKEEDLTEDTGVIPAKYPPKVTLENSSQLQSARVWVNYAYFVF